MSGANERTESRVDFEQEGTDVDRGSSVTHGKILGILALAGVLGTFAYGRIVGFNDNPRGPEDHFVLTDPKAEKEVTCLRELFNDLMAANLSRNRWMAENCNLEEMERLSSLPHPLQGIAEERDKVFIKQGIPQGTVKWKRRYNGQSDGFSMVTELPDVDKLRQAERAGKLRIRRHQDR